MARSSRFSVALHVLAHLARTREPQTSELLATCVGTHPVVVRRTLAGLRKAGLVTSTSGAGGGWMLARHPSRISLRDVSAGLGERLLSGIDVTGPAGHRGSSGSCRIQRAVAGALEVFMDDAEAMLADRLAGISLASLTERGRVGSSHRHSPRTR